MQQQVWSTTNESISSQGEIHSPEGKVCLIHDSTYPPLLHEVEYGHEFSRGINMDRGGIGRRDDGSFYGCLFDGTGGGGLDSAYAAQDFTEEMLKGLRQKIPQLTVDLATNLMVQSSLAISQVGSFYGDATCVFVDTTPHLLQGAALGDSGIIHIDGKTKKAHLFETILKDDRQNMSDTGGCISRRGMIYRPDNICVLVQEIQPGDFIVLASDGLIDNLFRSEESEVITQIINSSFFDGENFFDEELGELPDADTLARRLLPYKQTALTSITIARRLNRYLRLITAKKREALKRTLQAWQKAVREQDKDALEALSRQFKESDLRFIGKLDDCLIIAFET